MKQSCLRCFPLQVFRTPFPVAQLPGLPFHRSTLMSHTCVEPGCMWLSAPRLKPCRSCTMVLIYLPPVSGHNMNSCIIAVKQYSVVMVKFEWASKAPPTGPVPLYSKHIIIWRPMHFAHWYCPSWWALWIITEEEAFLLGFQLWQYFLFQWTLLDIQLTHFIYSVLGSVPG